MKTYSNPILNQFINNFSFHLYLIIDHVSYSKGWNFSMCWVYCWQLFRMFNCYYWLWFTNCCCAISFLLFWILNLNHSNMFLVTLSKEITILLIQIDAFNIVFPYKHLNIKPQLKINHKFIRIHMFFLSHSNDASI